MTKTVQEIVAEMREHYAQPIASEWADELEAASKQQPCPDGWRIVPVEPTEEMRDAAFDAAPADGDFFRAEYMAAIAAAPSPETTK